MQRYKEVESYLVGLASRHPGLVRLESNRYICKGTQEVESYLVCLASRHHDLVRLESNRYICKGTKRSRATWFGWPAATLAR